MSWIWKDFWNCAERTGPGLWVEPANLISGLAFPLAAFVLWRQAQLTPEPGGRRAGKFFALLLLLVGLGSTTFHLFANGIGLLVDALFVVVFVHALLPIFLMRVLKWGRGESMAALGLFVLAELLPRFISIKVIWWHLIALTGVWTMAWLSHRARVAPRQQVRLAATLMSVAMLCHLIDRPIAPWVSFGTHFIWHLCTACVLYLLAYTVTRPLDFPATIAEPQLALSSEGSA